MATIPGSAGLPLLGDKSYDFYKDPVKFMDKNIEHYGTRNFIARFLNKPTVFVGCHNTLKKLLTEEADNLDLGYKMFMADIYGDNILFTDGVDMKSYRESLCQLFTTDAVNTYQQTIQKVVKNFIQNLETQKPVCLYQTLKRLCIEVCLSLFLGLDFDTTKDLSETIVSLTTTHWHGIISVPVNLKLPVAGSSTFSKALDAKAKLLDIIEHRKTKTSRLFPSKIQEVPKGDSKVFVNNHLLLFTSALVPKALSSLLTSFMIEIMKENDLQEKVLRDEDLRKAYMLEVQRMYPPFFGGRRVINKDIVVNGSKFPKGHAIVFSTYAAHQDPQVFHDPQDFQPQRWLKNQENTAEDDLFCFGGGPRCCLGQQLVWCIINTIVDNLLSQYTVVLQEGQDLTHKWLPVSRPKQEVNVQFTNRKPVSDISMTS